MKAAQRLTALQAAAAGTLIFLATSAFVSIRRISEVEADGCAPDGAW